MTHKNDGFIENLMKVPAPLKWLSLRVKQLNLRLYSSYDTHRHVSRSLHSFHMLS